jgi:hypothetical protein
MIAVPIIVALLFIIAMAILIWSLQTQSVRDAAERARLEAEEQAQINLALSEASLTITKITTEAVAAMYEAGRRSEGS